MKKLILILIVTALTFSTVPCKAYDKVRSYRDEIGLLNDIRSITLQKYERTTKTVDSVRRATEEVISLDVEIIRLYNQIDEELIRISHETKHKK